MGTAVAAAAAAAAAAASRAKVLPGAGANNLALVTNCPLWAWFCKAAARAGARVARVRGGARVARMEGAERVGMAVSTATCLTTGEWEATCRSRPCLIGKRQDNASDQILEA